MAYKRKGPNTWEVTLSVQGQVWYVECDHEQDAQALTRIPVLNDDVLHQREPDLDDARRALHALQRAGYTGDSFLYRRLQRQIDDRTLFHMDENTKLLLYVAHHSGSGEGDFIQLAPDGTTRDAGGVKLDRQIPLLNLQAELQSLADRHLCRVEARTRGTTFVWITPIGQTEAERKLETAFLYYLHDEFLKKGSGPSNMHEHDRRTMHTDVMNRFYLDVPRYRKLLAPLEAEGDLAP